MEALELLKEPSYKAENIEKDIDYLVKKFNISHAEFEKILQTEAKFYKDLSPSFPKKVLKAEKKISSLIFQIRRQLLGLSQRNRL